MTPEDELPRSEGVQHATVEERRNSSRVWLVWASTVFQTVKTASNAEDLDLILGLGRTPGEGKGIELQYS